LIEVYSDLEGMGVIVINRNLEIFLMKIKIFDAVTRRKEYSFEEGNEVMSDFLKDIHESHKIFEMLKLIDKKRVPLKALEKL
jgi:hypothetical protein